MIAQGNRTKLQMQTIQQASRVSVDKSVHGVQHSKTMLVRTTDKSYLVIGRANWTTASRSNVEMAVLSRRSVGPEGVHRLCSKF